LPNNTGLIEAIQHIVQNEHITKIVIGLSENQMAELTKKFASELEKAVSVPIEFYDETLSSYEVHQKMSQGAHSQSKRGEAIDHLAAAEMLQNYLDDRE
jgi:putative transcription antitermination factor YqgF